MFTEKKKKRVTEIPSSSTSDIAFLLLVFFLLVSTIDQDKGVQMLLPPMGGELEINKKNITIVQINSEGIVLFNDEIVPLKQINVRTKNMITKNPKMIFSVQTYAKTKYQYYLRVIYQLKISYAKRLDVILPTAKKIETLEGSKRHVAYVFVGRDGIISIDDKMVKPNDVSKAIYQKRKDDNQLTISLRADHEVAMKAISNIHSELRKANALKINYSATTKATPY